CWRSRCSACWPPARGRPPRTCSRAPTSGPGTTTRTGRTTGAPSPRPTRRWSPPGHPTRPRVRRGPPRGTRPRAARPAAGGPRRARAGRCRAPWRPPTRRVFALTIAIRTRADPRATPGAGRLL
ncbi:MAG: hypothetical protein AVDCRST_MAG48-470, partial [uncultured Friedmanniella sp.]